MSKFNLYLNLLKLKGNLAYEYHPFHNYLTEVDLYEVDTNYGKIIVPEHCAVDDNTGEILKTKIIKGNTVIWYNSKREIVEKVKLAESGELYATAGSLVDFDTEQLNFDLKHPVDIEIQPSYDGSVNLILNDDKNIPRLINSRFSPREKNTYEIVDRIGENDTNIYNSKSFDKDVSLYYLYEKNPKIEYSGLTSGDLPVGQYCFYLTYCDADNNESDFISESGLIPVFLGDDKDPSSMDGGIKNQNSNKGINLKIKNIDKSYSYLKIYYLRYFADYLLNRVYELKKLIKKISTNTSIINFTLTGHENTEDLDPNILNISRFNPSSVLTQALCKNILFFGNIVKNVDNYKELTDCALRITPSININKIEMMADNYYDFEGNYGYYDSNNIYNFTGYLNEEYYRFGVVFIYNNGSISNVYNTLGYDLLDGVSLKNIENIFLTEDNGIYLRNYISIDDTGWINDFSNYYEKSGGTVIQNVNGKGVCRIYCDGINIASTIGIKFEIPEEVVNFLKTELGIRGLFFVRQKCIPTILGQCYLLPMDKNLQAPVLYSYNKDKETNKYTYKAESFITLKLNNDYLLENNYDNRLIENDNKSDIINKRAYAAICPDFLLNQPYYNQIFNGNSFYLGSVNNSELNLKYDQSNLKYRITNSNNLYTSFNIGIPKAYYNVKICSVTDNVRTVAIEDCIYRLEIGNTESVTKFRYFGEEPTITSGSSEDNIYNAKNIVRGMYSPYLAVYSESNLPLNCLYNIYSAKYDDINLLYLDRMNSYDAYYAINDRYNFEEITKQNKVYSEICYRGDSYVNKFTYRLNRNFNDPSLPNNDTIIDKNTWKLNYKESGSNTETINNISRSDVNAVRLGSWITITLRSNINYALRSVDHSYVSEEAMMGNPRSFYPKNKLFSRGENKLPDSYLYNDAFRATLGFKCYYTLEDVNYIKNSFSNRILYSSISIQDSYKNNYRESLSTYFRDYSQEYGGIMKLVELNGNLIVIFEHGIGLATVNEKILAGQGEGGPVFINILNVLPEELLVISDTIGTLWPESVVKSELGFIYGVDTVSKKIWRLRNSLIEIISDFKVNDFLINNITLGERENSPIIGLRNVKTHYNNNKKDIMFTFYDDVYKDEERVWNLCYNELVDNGTFITFYSWLPSYSANIDTQFFTFNRNTSKWLSLLLKSNYNIPDNFGVLVDNPVLKDYKSMFSLKYRIDTSIASGYELNKEGESVWRKSDYQTMANKFGEIENIRFRIEKDHWGNHKYIKYNEDNGNLYFTKNLFTKYPVIILEITPYVLNNEDPKEERSIYFPTETIALTLKEIVNNQAITAEDKAKPNLTTDFYLHGEAGLINIKEDLYPTYWYGEWHPFEFEFVVNDKIALNKVFSNLIIISNKTEPESFHFEINGDDYEFSKDKRTMYFRQEATKELYLNHGSDIIFDRKYTDVAATKRTLEQYYRSIDYITNYNKLDRVYPEYKEGLVQSVKSTLFPLYYNRIDTYNEVYDSYTLMDGKDNYDFKNLSGSEIVWEKDLNLFNIVTHIKNSPINLNGIIRGNSIYKDGKWNVQIPSINYIQKNEQNWGKYPPIIINSSDIPEDLLEPQDNQGNQGNYLILSSDKIPNIYNAKNDNIYNYIGISLDGWTLRKSTKIRDKWIKIKIRYSGKNLAVIHSLITLYNTI